MKIELHILKKILTWVLIAIVLFSFGAGASFFYFQKQNFNSLPNEEKKNAPIDFLSEIYDNILKEYWDIPNEAILVNFFKQKSESLTGNQYTLKSTDRAGLREMLETIIKDLKVDQKKEFSVTLAATVLSNLAPQDRSGLYTLQDEKELANRVNNVNPETGVIEPSIVSELVRPDIFYIAIKRFSPTSFDEFQKAANSLGDQKGIDTLILDLRGNIGGSIDILQYFLGPFIGIDQYAYEFLHQGERQIFKTKTGWLPSLVRYKKMVILVDGQSQSTVEVMAGVLKKYNVGVVVGIKTKGWGTVEKVFEINNQIDSQEKYSMFLVHSLTLADDNQLIEGRGIVPNISLDDAAWQTELFSYFHYPELGEVIKELWNKK